MGSPRATELSNISPSVVQPVLCTSTSEFGRGCRVPVPGVSTLLANPLAVLLASGGGAATSAGAGMPDGFFTRSSSLGVPRSTTLQPDEASSATRSAQVLPL